MVENFVADLATHLKGSFLLSYLAVYLGGLLVSFTPCIYPVVPITVAFIGARGSGSRSRAFLLSLIYVLGMAATYTVLGAVAALSGKLFGQIQSIPLDLFSDRESLHPDGLIHAGSLQHSHPDTGLHDTGTAQEKDFGNGQQLPGRGSFGACHGPLHGSGAGSRPRLMQQRGRMWFSPPA